jgi:LCP family protein required for cell wall assembly
MDAQQPSGAPRTIPQPQQPTAPDQSAPHRRSIFRRHLALTTLATIIALVIGSAGGFAWYLNHQLGNIRHFDAGITPAHGSNGSTSDDGRPLNVLVLASHDRNTQSVADDLADGQWTRGVHNSDAIMVVHIPANRSSAQIVSIPIDSWVKVPGYPSAVSGRAKIDASFGWGGPALAVRTVEELTSLHIDHVAMIDWNGFMDLVDVVGGVRIFIPRTFTDRTQHVTWVRGWHTFSGYQALQYLRTRHGLVDGDLGRIERQQNFLRTIMAAVLSRGPFSNPLTLARIMGTLSHFMQVDDSWTTGELRTLGFAMRNLGSDDVTFATAPATGVETVAGQQAVRLNPTSSRAMFQALGSGRLREYVQANPGTALPGAMAIR